MKHPTVAPYGAFPCADGKVLLISIQNEREWQRFCKDVLGDENLPEQEGFRSNVERVANRGEVDQRCAEHFRQFDREANIRSLATAGIAYGRLSDLDDLMTHPQNRFIRVETEHGEVELLSPASVVLGRTETFGAVPGKDEHGDRIRKEFKEFQLTEPC